MRQYRLILPTLLSWAFLLPMPAAEHSALWGTAGEAWTADGRLPDVSRAGYRDGDAALPAGPVTADVKTFGAVGDGVADDTAAFATALQTMKPGVLLVPPGRYRITDRLVINRSSVVLRGAGPQATVLWFPESLSVKRPRPTQNRDGTSTSQYSWSGGFLALESPSSAASSIRVTGESPRGGETLTLDSVAGIAPGMRLELRLEDDAGLGLSRWILDGAPGDIAKLAKQDARQILQVVAVDPVARTIRCDRPLRVPTRAAWSPVVVAVDQRVREAGIEHLTCEFPATPYLGHFSESGYNAISIGQVVDCWVQDVAIVHAESGIFLDGSHCTLSGIVFTSGKTEDRVRCNGHHGIMVTGSDNLITGFDVRQRFIHDLSVQNASCAGNAFSRGRSIDLCLDHHKEGPFANVFTELDCGAGNRVWECGGGPQLGLHSGGWATFWNLRAKKPIPAPPHGWGPATMNLVGLGRTSDTDGPGPWVEAIAAEDLEPQDLHTAQRTRRLAATRPPPGMR